jgi:ribose transport system substrate-binding protein
MAMGAWQALVSAGLQDKVVVYGFDGAEDVIRSIGEGKVSATGMQFPKVMAEQAVVFADEYVKGRRDFPQKIPVAVELVTKDNISDYIAYGEK